MPDNDKIARSANIMRDLIVGDEALLAQVKTDPKKTLTSVAAQVTKAFPTPAYVSDTLTYRIAVLALGIVVICAMVGAVYLTAAGYTLPDLLTALGAAAIGALAGLLTPVGARPS